MKIKTKLPGVALMLGLVIVGIIIATRIISNQQKNDGLVINLAGRQRMLTQRITKELLFCVKKTTDNNDITSTKASLDNSMKVFDKTLIALRDGKDAPLDLDLSKTKYRKCPIPKENVKKQLNIVTSTWKEFSSAISSIIESDFSDLSKLPTIEKTNIKLLKESNAAVKMMQKESEKKIGILNTIQNIGLLIGAIFVGIAFYVVFGILKKLKSVNNLVEQFSKGDITNRVKVENVADELDETMVGVNKLGESIAAIVTEIFTANNTLISVSRNFADSFDEISQNAETMQRRSTTVAAAAEESSATVNSISSSAEEMSTSVSTVASSMEEMSASINEVAKSCQQESKIAQEASEKVTVAGKTIKELGTSAKEIGRIISAINDIANKTNLLALNATIEAASAGEAGKGFAVVANEVKDLAKQTSTATEEIKSQIEEIQAKTTLSVDGIHEVEGIIEEVNVISQTIVAAVEEQSATINEIAHSVEGASGAATEIAHNVSETATGISEVTENIQQVNKETNEVTSNIFDAKDKVNKLASLGEDLKAVVGTFNIGTKFIEWGPEYSVNISEIDKQHKRLVEMINDLNSAMSDGLSKQDVERIISGLIDYTGTHFGTEEKYMDRYGYPDTEEHKKIHKNFVDTVLKFSQDFSSGKALLSKDIMIFLKDWLIKHIQGTDKKYTEFFRKNGLR